MEEYKNKRINTILEKNNINWNNLSNYEKKCLVQLEEYFDNQINSSKMFFKNISFNGISVANVTKDNHIGKNVPKQHECISFYIKMRNREYINMLNECVGYKSNRLNELKQENELLKKRDVEYELLKIENSTLKKDNKDLHKEILRLRRLLTKKSQNTSTVVN